MTTQVLRFVPREAADVHGGLAAHHRRENDFPKRTVPADETHVVYLVEEDRDGAAQAIERGHAERRRRKMPGSKPLPYVEAMIAGPPRYEPDPDWGEERRAAWVRERAEWNEAREREWAHDVLAWFRTSFPAAFILRARLDRDESAPHVSIDFVPITDLGLLGWRQLERERCAKLGRNPDLRGEPYRALQDDLHEVVMSRYGLARGEAAAKTKRKHMPIDRDAAERGHREAEIVSLRNEVRELRAQVAERDYILAVRNRDLAEARAVNQEREARLRQRERERVFAVAGRGLHRRDPRTHQTSGRGMQVIQALYNEGAEPDASKPEESAEPTVPGVPSAPMPAYPTLSDPDDPSPYPPGHSGRVAGTPTPDSSRSHRDVPDDDVGR